MNTDYIKWIVLAGIVLVALTNCGSTGRICLGYDRYNQSEESKSYAEQTEVKSKKVKNENKGI